jgi:hypothetical protein
VSCFSSTCRYNTVHVPCGISIQSEGTKNEFKTKGKKYGKKVPGKKYGKKSTKKKYGKKKYGRTWPLPVT